MNREEILKEINLVFECLKTLEAPEGDGEEKKGYYKRDFGMDIWGWPQGVALYGLYTVAKANKDEEIFEYLKTWYEQNYKHNIIKNINSCAPFLALSKLNDSDFDGINDEWSSWLLNDLPKTKKGIFQHLTDNSDGTGVLMHDNQVWIDTIYMSVLFMLQEGIKNNDQEKIEEANFQILQHIKYLFDIKQNLFYHGWSFERNDHFGGVFWARGNSWFTCAIVDYIEMIGTKHPISRYLISILESQIDKLMELRNDKGLWHTVLDDPTSYIEISGSTAIARGVLKAIRLKYIDDRYLQDILKTIDSIVENIDENGVVQNVSAGTSIGLDKKHYHDIIIGPMAYGQSLVILLLGEYLEFLKEEK